MELERIRDARRKAGDANFTERGFIVDWSKANHDKRKGNIHAWDDSKLYLGHFTTHAKAVERGAIVTRFMSMWFDWT